MRSGARSLIASVALAVALVAGCATHHNVNVGPIRVQPIRVTMDVNVNVHESEEPVGEDAENDATSGSEAPDEPRPRG